MTTHQQILLEIETDKMRHAWAKAERNRGEPSLALVKYLDESLQELRALKPPGSQQSSEALAGSATGSRTKAEPWQIPASSKFLSNFGIT